MKCAKCGSEILPGDECIEQNEDNVEVPMCGKCYEEKRTGPTAPPEVRTRKPRNDRGKPRGPKAGPWVLQSQAGDKRYWCDLSGYPTEAKAWASVKEAGRYRVIRVHGQERTATEKTTIMLE